MKPRVSVVVPAYNERSTIAATLREIAEYFKSRRDAFEIIVAADGDDGTREQALALGSELPITVVGTRRRGGKGRAVREGVRLAAGEIIGFMDADNKTSISEFAVFDRYLSEGYDIAIGARGHPETVISRPQPLYRRLGAKAFQWVMHFMTGLTDIPDTQCGFKFFRREAAIRLFSRSRIDGYMFDVEIIAMARRLGYRIAQVPVNWKDDGDSRLRLVTGNLRNMWDMFRIRSARSQPL